MNYAAIDLCYVIIVTVKFYTDVFMYVLTELETIKCGLFNTVLPLIRLLIFLNLLKNIFGL